MKVKKFLCALLTGGLLLSSTTALSVQAAPTESITDQTVITRSNAKEVAEYLDITNKVIPNTQNNAYMTYTVGELKDILETAQSMDSKSIILYDTTNNLPGINTFGSGVKSLTYTGYGDGNYTFTVIVGGKYSDRHWTGVGTIDASIESNQVATVYKIKENNLSATHTSTQITLGGNVNVGGYIGIAGIGLLETHSFKIEPYKVWNASSYL